MATDERRQPPPHYCCPSITIRVAKMSAHSRFPPRLLVAFCISARMSALLNVLPKSSRRAFRTTSAWASIFSP